MMGTITFLKLCRYVRAADTQCATAWAQDRHPALDIQNPINLIIMRLTLLNPGQTWASFISQNRIEFIHHTLLSTSLPGQYHIA